MPQQREMENGEIGTNTNSTSYVMSTKSLQKLKLQVLYGWDIPLEQTNCTLEEN